MGCDTSQMQIPSHVVPIVTTAVGGRLSVVCANGNTRHFPPRSVLRDWTLVGSAPWTNAEWYGLRGKKGRRYCKVVEQTWIVPGIKMERPGVQWDTAGQLVNCFLGRSDHGWSLGFVDTLGKRSIICILYFRPEATRFCCLGGPPVRLPCDRTISRPYSLHRTPNRCIRIIIRIHHAFRASMRTYQCTRSGPYCTHFPYSIYFLQHRSAHAFF